MEKTNSDSLAIPSFTTLKKDEKTRTANGSSYPHKNAQEKKPNKERHELTFLGGSAFPGERRQTQGIIDS